MGMVRTEPGRRVSLTVPFAGENGERGFPTQVFVSVRDILGNEIVPRHEFDPTPGTYTVGQSTTEPAGIQEAPEYPPEGVPERLQLVIGPALVKLRQPNSGKSEGLLVLVDGILSTGDSFESEFMVVIQADATVPWVSSAASYNQLMLAIWDMPVALTQNLLDMGKGERQYALADAFSSVESLPLVVRAQCKHKGKPFAGLGLEDRLMVVGLDPKFADAMLKAQILEACEASDDDPVAIARRNGLVSMSVGESSQFYGSGKTLGSTTRVTSSKAMALLSPWLDFSVRLART